MRDMYQNPQMPNGMPLQQGMLGGANPAAGGMPGMNGGGIQGFGGNQMMSTLGPLLSSFFGQGKNPADAAMGYMNKIPGTLKPYYNPYINAGRDAMGQLQGEYGTLMHDPGSIMNRIGGGFQQSPGYQFQKDEMTRAGNNAAAAGGYVGSPQAQAEMSQRIGGLANQDYWNYFNHGQQLYGQGLSGMNDINHMGFQASDSLAQSLAQALQNQAQLAYKGQDYRNQQNGGLWGSIGNLIGGTNLMKNIPGIGSLF